MARKRFLTLKQLDKWGACFPAQRIFKELFGERATLAAVLLASQSLPRAGADNWEAWLLSSNFSLTRALLAEAARFQIVISRNTLDAALFECLDAGDDRAAELLWNSGARFPEDWDLATAVHYGLRAVKFTLSKGADIHLHNDGALFEAIYEGSLPMVKLLLKHGANPLAIGKVELKESMQWLSKKSRLYKLLASYLSKQEEPEEERAPYL